MEGGGVCPRLVAVLGRWVIGKWNTQLQLQGGGAHRSRCMSFGTGCVWIWVPTLLLINIGTLQKLPNMTEHQLQDELGWHEDSRNCRQSTWHIVGRNFYRTLSPIFESSAFVHFTSHSFGEGWILPVYSLNVTQWHPRGQNRLMLFLTHPVLPEVKFSCGGFSWRWGKVVL